MPYFILDNQTYTQQYDIFAGSVSHSQKLTEKLKNTETKLSNKSNKEVAYIYNKKGNLVFSQGGSIDRISFDEDQILRMKDCVLTHNHPSGHKYDTNSILSIGSSFSYEDLETAIKGNLAEIRAITPHYVFSLKRPTTGWNEDILRQYTISADHIRNEYETLSINREDLFSMIFAHLIMKDLKKSFSLNYTKIKIT